MRFWQISRSRTAMENLWSAATFAANGFRYKYAKAGVVLTGEEWNEALDTIVLVSVRRFLNKLKNKKYAHEYTFYQNVHSCVFSVFHQQLNFYMDNVVKRKMNSLDRLDPETAQFLVDTSSRPMYNSTKEDRKIAMNNLKSWLSKCEHVSHLKSEWEYDYFMYVESCEETGIPVDKMNPMYILGAPYATGEIVKGVKMIIIRDSIEGDAVFGSLLVGGVKVCDTLENRKTLIPCGEYSLNVSKSPKFNRMLPLVYNDKVSMIRGIRMHAGNSAKDSAGCILVGFGRNGDKLINSRNAEAAVTGLAANDAKLIITTNGMI